MENDIVAQVANASKTLSFLILCGGKSKRFGGFPKLLCFMYGRNLILNIIDDLSIAEVNCPIRVLARSPTGEDIDGLLEVHGIYKKYENFRRIIYGKEADTKAFSIWEVTVQTVHTPLIAVLQGDVVYGSDLFRDFWRKVNEFYDKKLEDYAGLIYLAKSEPPSPAPSFKTKYDARHNINCLEEICTSKNNTSVHPVISVFDANKIKALEDVPRYESAEERAGTTYLYARFMKNGYKFCVVESDFTVADLNTPEAEPAVRAKLASKNT